MYTIKLNIYIYFFFLKYAISLYEHTPSPVHTDILYIS